MSGASNSVLTLTLCSASISNTKISAVDVASDGTSSLNSSYFTTSGNGPFSTDHDAAGYPRIDTTGDGSSIIFTVSERYERLSFHATRFPE